MKMTKHCTLIVFSLLTLTNCIAQNKIELKTKFGEITEAETKLLVYDKDSTAVAVILFDKATLTYNLTGRGDYDSELERHIRIKILKKEGYEHANVQIPYPIEHKLKGFKAASYNLEKGKWVETKLQNSSIFEEKIGKFAKNHKFTFPQVREGSILEYRYMFFVDGGFMPPVWYFQSELPMLWCEYEMHVPKAMSYLTVHHGDIPFLVDLDTMEKRREYGAQSVQWTHQYQRWVKKEVPALKSEPMIASVTNYRSRMTFQRKGMFGFLGDTWDNLGRLLLQAEPFGGVLKDKITATLVDSLTKNLKDDKAKVAAIYEYVGKNYELEPGQILFLMQPLKTLLKNHKGLSSELNLLIINMLKHAKIEVHPMIISTRSNGELAQTYPVLERMSRVIAYLPTLGKEACWIDMAGYPQPLGLLPFDDLNGAGFMIREKDSMKWVVVQNNLNTSLLFHNNLVINEKGILTGAIAMTATGYEASKMRESIEKDGKEKYANVLLKTLLAEGQLEEHRFENTDMLDEKPLNGQFKIQSTAYVTKTDSFMYISPMLFFAEKENLFKNPHRKFNIDYGYTRENNYILNLTIPDGYKLESVPKNTKLNFADARFSFTYVAEIKGNQLKINVKWNIRKVIFEVWEYPFLRDAYETIFNKMNEPIVLSKSK